MTPIAYITAFRGVTLHNGTDRFAINVISQSPVARMKIVTLPGGATYDAHETGDAPTAPGMITAVFFLKLGSPTAAGTEFETLAALAGKAGTLTAKRADDSIVSCTARLKKVVNIHKYRNRMPGQIKVSMEFQPTTDWS